MKKLKKWDLILIDWLDSVSTGGWRDIDRAEKQISEDDIKHQSVGYFLHETKLAIGIVQSRSMYTKEDVLQQVAELLQIPKKSILKIKIL